MSRLRSDPVTGSSSLLRATPSLLPASVLGLLRVVRLKLLPLHRKAGSHGRVGDWRAGLGRSLCSPVASPFRLRVSQHLDHATFPAPAYSNAACGFPALRSPVCFTPRFMGPILPARLSANVPNPVAVERLQGFVQPLPTPPHPAEALSFPSSHHMAPNLLLYPVLNEAKALSGVSNREVVHPTA